jgi:hypothetical protein
MYLPQEELPGFKEVPYSLPPDSVLAPIESHLREINQILYTDATWPQSVRSDAVFKDLKKNRRSSKINWDNGLIRLKTEIYRTAIGHFSSQPPQDNEPEAIESYLTEQLEQIEGASEESELIYLPYSIAAAVEVIRNFRSYTAITVGALDYSSVETRFQVMKLIASPDDKTKPKDKESDDYFPIFSFQAIYVFNLLDNQRTAVSPGVEKQLDKGEFDTLIARELLQQAVLEDGTLAPDGAPEMQKLLRLSAALNPGLPMEEYIERLCSPNAFANWTEDQLAPVEKQKNDYAEIIKAVFKSMEKALIRYTTFETRAELAEVDVMFERLALEIAKQKRGNIRLSPADRQRASRDVEVAKIKVKTRPSTPVADRNAQLSSASLAEGQPSEPTRTLLYLDINGDLHEENDSGFTELFDKYKRRFVSVEGLDEAWANARNYLKTVDLTGNRPSGLAKKVLSKDIQKGDFTITKVNELSLGQAGIETPTRVSRDTRALVAQLDSDTFAILDVYHLRSSDQYYRKYNIVSNKRRRR